MLICYIFRINSTDLLHISYHHRGRASFTFAMLMISRDDGCTRRQGGNDFGVRSARYVSFDCTVYMGDYG